MAEQKKRTSEGVFGALQQISNDYNVDFGIDGYTPETFKKRYFTGPGNIEILYNKLNKISDEEGLDFGQGTRDEWLASFGYKRSGEEGKYETLSGLRVGSKADNDRYNAFKKRQQQKVSPAQLQNTTASVQTPEVEAPEDVVSSTPWGTKGSATGQSRVYKPFTPGQVRTTDNPDAYNFPTPYRPQSQLPYAQRDQVIKQNDWVSQQINKMRKAQERREQPLVDTGNDEVNQHIIKTQGEWDDELASSANRISSSVVVPAVDKAIRLFDEKAHEVFGETQKGHQDNLPTGVASGATIFGNVRESNQAKDPEKVLQYLQQQMESVYKNSDFVEQIGKEADKLGIDRSEYLEEVIKPQIQNDLTKRFESSMIARELPKSGLEYVVSGLNNSIVGMIADTFLNTKSQRSYKNQAQAITEEGDNSYYNPSTAANLAKVGVTFAADAPFFGVYGRVGGQVVKNIAEREIQNMIAKGLSESAARSIVGTALENSAGARMKNYIMQHVVSGAITMGGFNATSEGVRQVRDDDYNALRLLGSTAEGVATGAAFGLTGGAVQALSQPLSGFSKLGAKAAGFGAEAETMYATEEAAKALQGEDAFENPFEGSVESLMKLGVMKASSPGGIFKAIGEVTHPIKSNQRNHTGISFTPEEESYVRSEGQSLLDALSGMHPERAISEVNGKKKLTKEGEQMRQQLAEAYNDFMDNTEIPANVKQKVAQTLGGVYRPGLETGADIIQNEDGSVVIKTRDQEGNCIQEIPFENYEQATQWQQQFKSQMSRNDATNMYNNASVVTKQRIVDIVRDLISGKSELENTLNRANGMRQNRMKRELEKYNQLAEKYAGREMTDEEARNYIQMVIKDGSDEVFNDLYNIIRQEAYPADELNTKRNYWEGRQIPDLDKHIAQVDAQLAEEQLMLLGEDFANEVMAAEDYPDEKMMELASRRDVSGAQLKAALDYYNKVSKLNGMMDETLKSIDDQVKAANAYVDRNTHPDSQSIIEVQDNDGKTYYVSAGHIQITPEGKLVGTDNTGMVILRDVNTGEIFTKSPSEVTVSAVKDPQMLKDANESMEGLRGELMAKANETIEINPETPETPQEMGETFMGADGKMYVVSGQPDETGQIIWAKLELNEQGNPTGEPQPLDIAEYRKAKSDEIDAATMSQSGPVSEYDTPVIEPTETPIEQELAKNEQEQPVIEQPQAGIEQPETPQEPQNKIPVNDKQEPQFEQAKPEDTLAELNSRYGEEKAQRMISQIAQATAKELEKLESEDTSGITDMAKLMQHEDKVKELQQKYDYWNNLIKKEEPVAETPVVEVPVAETAPVVEPEKPVTEESVVKDNLTTEQPVTEPETPADIKPEEPETPIQEPEQPAVPEKSAQQKVNEAAVSKNVGKHFTYTDNSGMRTSISIDKVTDDGKVIVTRQDFDADGKPMDKPKQQTFEADRIGQGIIEGMWKPVASTEEKLRETFKGKVVMQNMIDVLSEDEQQRMLDTYKSGDQEAFYELMNEFRENHREDMVLRERDSRNDSVDRILNGAGSREDKLRRVRKQFQGWDDAEVMLSDEALQPTTLEEYVSDLHSRVPQKGEGQIAYYSYGDGADRIVGLQDETGFGNKTGADTKGFAPWLAPKGKGMSLQKYAETIHSQLPEAIQQQYSDQDVRNAILDVFGAAQTPSDIPLMVIRRGVLQAEQAARRMEEAIIDGDISYQKADRSFASRLRRAVEQTAKEPTEKQKEAGNYAKGHLSFGGYHFSVENPKGSIRRGTDASGKEWETKMNNTYGYILGKKGKDGDHLDMFINDNADLDNWNGNVYVVDQIDPKTGKFDESKILYGFNSEEEARQAYLSNYAKGWQGLGEITGVDKDTFDKWLDSSDRQQKEFAKHSIIKHKVESQVKTFDQAVSDLSKKGLSIDDKDLLDKYGLKSVTLSKRGDVVSMTHLVANKMGEGNGTRFMNDLARLADEKGWTLALTPGLGLGAKSKRRLEQFYKRFGFVPNRGRNADFSTMEAMIRHPKDWNPDTPERQEQLLRDAVVDHLRSLGVNVSTDWKEGQQILDKYNGEASLSKAQKRALETASLPSEEDQATVVSSADGAKILKNLDTLVKDFENLSNQPKFFIGALAEKLEAKRDNSKSEYATFETKNGKIVTIRLADHNATVSDFDHRNENDGISIVITTKGNNKITNDGDAHIVEYFYDAYKLRRSKEKPLVDIIKSIKQALYSGEYKDTTGLAEREEVNADQIRQHKADEDKMFFKTPDGHAYGYTYKGNIYIDPRIATTETPIHEYGHLWVQAKRASNPEEWNEIKQTMLNDPLVQPIIDKVRQQYPELNKEGKEDLFAEEIITQFSGKRGNERLHEIAEEVAKENGGIFGKAEAVTAMQRLKNILNRFWEGVAKMMGWKYRNANQIADKIMADLLNGVDPRQSVRKRASQILAQQKAEAPIFVSNAMKAVEGIKQEKATPEQWLAMIEKSGGLKAGEDKWIGLSDWLKEQQKDKKSITKQEIQDYIRQNQIQVEEKRYVEGMPEKSQFLLDQFNQEFEELLWEGENETGSIYAGDWADWAFDQMKERYGDDFASAFDIEGSGSNSHLVPALDFSDEISDAAKYYLQMGEYGDAGTINSTRLDYTTNGLSDKREIALTVPTVEPYNKSDEVHFGDAGDGRAIAWVRFGDAYDTDGKRVLVVDEIQSKRHQDAREKGYIEKPRQEEIDRANEETQKYGNFLYDKYIKGQHEGEDFLDYATQEEKDKFWELANKSNALKHPEGVPQAPFEKNWHELAMKRILRLAAEEGYDKVAWTTGAQQADRYNIGNKVSKITVIPEEDGDRIVSLYFKHDDGYLDFSQMRVDSEGKVIHGDFSGRVLSEVVGKDLAVKLLAAKENQEFKDNNLRIGGEGMKGFYDDMLPRFMNKYGKKWGVKVGEVEMPELGDDDRVMHSIDVTPEMKESVMQGQPMFQKVAKDMDKTLMGMHNISEEKLKKAIKLGGLANPSMAVVDTKNGTLDNFGEISLIPKSDLIDKKKGRNAGTWASDAYTPRFPTTYLRISDKNRKQLKKYLDSLGLNDEMAYQLWQQFNDYYNSFSINENALQYAFLKEKGLTDKVDYVRHDDVSPKFEELIDKYGNNVEEMIQRTRTDEEFRKEVGDMIINEEIANAMKGTRRKEGENAKDYTERRKKEADVIRKLLSDENGMATFDLIDHFLRTNSQKMNQNGKFDGRETLYRASRYISDNKLEDEYAKYFADKANELGIEEMIRNGSDRMGRPKFKPVTLEDISKRMKQEGRAGGEGGFGDSPGALRAKLAPMLDSLEAMRREKGRLVSHDDFEAEKDPYFEEVFHIQHDFFNGDFEDMLKVLKSSDMEAKAKSLGYDLDAEDMIDLEAFKNLTINLPTEYFETKFERPVKLDEFEIAVVPETTDPKVVDALKEAGLDVRKYESHDDNPEGTRNNRTQTIMDAVMDRDDIMFQMVGEKGAAEADKAEGVNTRQESLNIADSMEKDGKDSRAIKLATGWERGKDGKWRYETVDEKADILDDYNQKIIDHNNKRAEFHKEQGRLLDLYDRMGTKIPKRLDSKKYSEEEQAKFREMRKEREKVWKQYMTSNDQEKELVNNAREGHTTKLVDLLGENHELFKYYPQLKDVAVRYANNMQQGIAGSYNDKDGIKISIDQMHVFGDNKDLNNDNVNGILVHEIQHAIQDIEGFAKGGNLYTATSEAGINAIVQKKQAEQAAIANKIDMFNKWLNNPEELKLISQLDRRTVDEEKRHLEEQLNDLTYQYDRIGMYIDKIKHDKAPALSDARDLYSRLAGEVEARNASERINMSEEERRKTPIEKTEDYARENQVVMMEYPEGGDEGLISFQKVDDTDELKKLEKEPTVKRYRAMQLIDGKLYPPMSAKVDGQMRQPTEIGVWEKAEERPDLVKNGKFVLNKAQKGQSNVPAAYNPYFHTSTSGLNDQFTSAYKRPELVVVEVEIPESELTSGYKAEGAKDAVGNVDWHSGVVNGQLPADRQRQVTLSRYSKVNRVVPDSEVADMIAKQLDGTDIAVPYNVVTPSLRAELEKKGVTISDKPAGSVTEDINGNPIRYQRVGEPESEMTPEERQYWNKWDADMKKWRERNAIPEGVDGPGEKPKFRQGESALDFAQRLMDHNRAKALWKTAPKLEDYRQRRDDKDVLQAARENEQRYPDSPAAKMRRVAAELQQIRHAMSQQKAYDKATVKAVTDFAQDFMKMGFGDNLSRGEMERMLSSVKNATGANDIKKHVDNVMSILTNNYLKNLKAQVIKLASVKELRQTAQGVDKQGKLELKGQKMIQEFRKAVDPEFASSVDDLTRDMDAVDARVNSLRERLGEISEHMETGDPSMWEEEYEGTSLALQYFDTIARNQAEVTKLKELRQDAVKNYKNSGRDYKAQQELLEYYDRAIEEAKIERIGMYGELINRLQGNISESMQGAKEFTERKKERIKYIHTLAARDMDGIDADTTHEENWKTKLNNSAIPRLFFGPLGTFEQMLKSFGRKNANGEGWLYNEFMRKYIDSVNQEQVGREEAFKELDTKVSELFGKKMRLSDLYGELRDKKKYPDVTVSWLTADGETKEHTVSQAQLLSIYMWNKQTDGAIKLREQGITNEKVEEIKDAIDPRLIKFADWFQSEFSPKLREGYSKVYERVFGAAMPAVENYFPLRVIGDSITRDVDVTADPNSDNVLPSNTTGAIIRRKPNSKPLDILGTDAISLMIEHIDNMEKWASHVEWYEDINALLSYNRFKNQVKNDSSIYGSVDKRWENFRKAAQMAAGTYRPTRSEADKAITTIASGVTGAKIAFRPFTALKQLTSSPAFLYDSSAKEYANSFLNPKNFWHDNIKWAMENMPVIRKRWQSRDLGDTRLTDTTGWGYWDTKVRGFMAQYGMWMNGAIDFATCAAGARAIYNTRLKKYKKQGFSEEQAHKKALQDAEIGYNLTQQSSEGAFVSTVQKDRTLFANMWSVFRNSSMAYTRQSVDAVRNLYHLTKYKDESVGFMKKQLEAEGLSPEQAQKSAKEEYKRAYWHNAVKLAVSAWVLPIFWELSSRIPYLIWGDDDKEKENMVNDVLRKELVSGPFEGLMFGQAANGLWGAASSRDIYNTYQKEGFGKAAKEGLKQMSQQETSPLPLFSDMGRLLMKFSKDEAAGLQDLVNLAVQMGTGLNPQTITDPIMASIDASRGDLTKAKEIELFLMRLMMVPEESAKNIYLDEIDMYADDAKKLSFSEAAERYAKYKTEKGAPFFSWKYDDEDKKKLRDRYINRFAEDIQKRIDRLNDEELLNTIGRVSDEDEKKMLVKIAKKRLGITDQDKKESKSDKDWYQKYYNSLMDGNDLKEDETLSQKRKDYREYDNTDKTRQEVNKRLDWIRDGKYDSPSGRKGKHKNPEDDPELLYPGKKQLDPNGDPKKNEEIMKNIRKWRKEALEILIRGESVERK